MGNLKDVERNKSTSRPFATLFCLLLCSSNFSCCGFDGQLRFLYLSNNELEQLDEEALRSFGSHLEALNLAGNRLTRLPWPALTNCPKLLHLNVADNVIEHVGDAMFEGWAASLQVLTLKGNRISRLPAGLFRHAGQLRELTLSLNPLASYREDSLLDLAHTLLTLELNMALAKVGQWRFLPICCVV